MADKSAEKPLDRAQLKAEWQKALPVDTLSTQSLNQLADFVGRYFDLVNSFKLKDAKSETKRDPRSAKIKIDAELRSELTLIKKRAKELLIKYIDYVADVSSLVANKASAIKQPEEWNRHLDRIYEVYIFMTDQLFDNSLDLDLMFTSETDGGREYNLGEIKAMVCELDSLADNDALKEKEIESHITKLRKKKHWMQRSDNPVTKNYGGLSSKLPYFLGFSVAKYNDTFSNGFNHDLEEHLKALVNSLYSAGKAALLQDSRYTALKSVFALKHDQRFDALQNPAMGVLFRQFNCEVQQWTEQKIALLSQRFAQQEKTVAGGGKDEDAIHPNLRYFLLLVQAYLKQKVIDFKAGVESVKQRRQIVDVDIEALVLQKLDKEALTEDQLLKFSDYFTLLPGKVVKEGKVVKDLRKEELAKKILKNSSFSGVYKKNLIIQDKFGNSLLSMALGALPEKDKESFLKFKEEAKNEEIQSAPEEQKKILQEMKDAMQKAKKQNDLNDYLQPINPVLLRRRLKKSAKDLEEEKKRVQEDPPTFADTSFTQYMKDPARQVLRSQLCFEGVAECFPARYPRNRSEQTAFYQKIFAKFGDQLGHYLEVILKEYIDFSNTAWIPAFQQALDKNKIRLAAKQYDHICSRLISNAMPALLFKQIKAKSLSAVSQFGHKVFQRSLLGKQVQDLFHLGFATVGVMKDVIETQLFDSHECTELDEDAATAKNKRQYLLLGFLRREVPRQLLLYYALYGDSGVVKSLIDRLLSEFEFRSALPDVMTDSYADYLLNIGTQTFFQLLPSLHSQSLNAKDLNYELVKAVALHQDFKANEGRAAMYLGLLHHDFAPFQESDLASFVLNKLKPNEGEDNEKVETAGFLLIKSLVLGFNSGKKVAPLLLMAADFLGKTFAQLDVKKWLWNAVSHLFNLNLDSENVGEVLMKNADWDLRLNGSYSQAVESAYYSGQWYGLRQVAMKWRKTQVEAANKRRSKNMNLCRDPADNLKTAKDWKESICRRLRKAKNPINLLVSSFCKQALEVMPSFFQEQGNNELLCTITLAIFKLSGRRHVLTQWLKFVALNYARGSDHLKAFCAFLINTCMKDICDSSNRHEDQPGGKSPLLRNIFIETAIQKGWASEEVKVSQLLKPILAGDKKSARLTQEQLLNIVLLADYSDFRAVALSTAFTDDVKLTKIMGIHEAEGDKVLKAELLKLLKIPGMNRHCLKYLTFVESITVASVSSHAKLEDMMREIARLNDADFERVIPLLWKHYQAQNNSGAMKVIYLTAWVSGSLRKLCTVLRYTDDVQILGKSFNGPILDKMFNENPTDDSHSPLSYFMHGMNAHLGRLLAIAMLAKESIPLMPTPPMTVVNESNLAEYLNRGQTYFGFRFLKVRDQVEKALGILRDSKPPMSYMHPSTSEKHYAKTNLQAGLEIKDAKPLLVKLMSAFSASQKPLEAGECLFVFADQVLYTQFLAKPEEGVNCKSQQIEATGLYVEVLKNETASEVARTLQEFLDEVDSMESDYKSKFSKSHAEQFKFLDEFTNYYSNFLQRLPRHVYFSKREAVKKGKKEEVSRDLSVTDKIPKMHYEFKDMPLLVKLFNQEGRPHYFESLAKGCVYLMAFNACCPKDVGEVAHSIKDPKKLVSHLADAYMASLTKPPKVVKKVRNEEDEEEEEEVTFFLEISNKFPASLLYFGLMFVSLVPDKALAEQLLASLKSAGKESLETVYRIVYLQEDRNRDQLKQVEAKAKDENQRKLAEGKAKIQWSKFEKVDEEISSQPSFNKAAFDLVKNFLEQSKAQTLGPLRDQIHKEMDESRESKNEKKKTDIKDIMELLQIIGDNTLALGSTPGMISDHTFCTRTPHHILHFTPEFIKEVFKIDSKLAASKTDEDLKELQRQEVIARTKLLKASALWNSALSDVIKINPLSLYSTDDKFDQCMHRTTNPFQVLLEASEAHIFVCNKGQQIPTSNPDGKTVCLQVWFDVTKAKEESPAVKVNYLLSMTTDGKTFEFNPKHRHHSSLFDMMALHHWMAKDIEKTSSRIDGEMLKKIVDPKQGYQSCSLLKLPKYEDRTYFSTKFDDNLIGHSKPNQKFAAKLRVIEDTSRIFTQVSQKKKGLANEPVNVSDEVTSALGGKIVSGGNQKTTSSLSAWEATVRSL